MDPDHPTRRSALALLMASAALPVSSTFAAADDWPNRPIRVLVAFPAGGSADIVARLVTQAMAQGTGWNFVVDNRPGAGGNIAFEAAAKAEPDGYTLVFSTPGVVINPHIYAKVPYHWESLQAIGLVGEAPLVLMCNPKLPIHDIAELQATARAKPGALRFASSGFGSSSHLAMEVLRISGGVGYTHIPYKGGGPAMNDTIAGVTDLTLLPLAESMPNIRSERLRALGQTGRERASMAPDIPTIAEGGIRDYAATTWYVPFAPAKTPRAVIDKVYAAMSAALKTPDLQQRLQQAGVQVIDQGPKQAAEFVRAEHARWARVVAASGTRVE